jgi:hypothetical protein
MQLPNVRHFDSVLKSSEVLEKLTESWDRSETYYTLSG